MHTKTTRRSMEAPLGQIGWLAALLTAAGQASVAAPVGATHDPALQAGIVSEITSRAIDDAGVPPFPFTEFGDDSFPDPVSPPALVTASSDEANRVPDLQAGIVTEIGSDLNTPPPLPPRMAREFSAGATADPVLQPGIVTEVTNWQSGFSFEDSPLLLGLRADMYYDDNVFLLPGGFEEGDFIWEITPLIGFESSRAEIGKRHYLRFGYDPQLLRFSKFHMNDAENHRGFAAYRFRGSKIELGFDQRSAQFSGTERELEDAFFDSRIDVDVGRRTEGVRHYSNAFADINLDEATQLLLSATRYSREFDTTGLVSSAETRGEITLTHRFYPKTEAGLGVVFGQFDTDGAIDTDFGKLLGLVRWEPSSKLEVDFQAGVDLRDKKGPEGSDKLATPVFEAGVNWSKTSATTFSLAGFQRIDFSVSGESVRRTGVRGSVRQRIFRRTHYTLRGGYESSRFETPEGRTDDYFFVRNSVDWKWSWGSVGVFHELRQNESDVRSGFERNQAGLGMNIEF